MDLRHIDDEIVGPSFLVQLTLEKLIQKKIHVIGEVFWNKPCLN